MLTTILAYGFVLAIVVFGAVLVLFIRNLRSAQPKHRWRPEVTRFEAPDQPSGWASFPRSLSEPAEVYLSVIVPAYNEEARLPPMLEETQAHLESMGQSWEIIVVDDGSRDGTCDLVLQWCERLGTDRIRLLRMAHNVGKGGAVRRGMMAARGEYLLMADADGASQFSDVDKLLERMHALQVRGRGMVVGSRAHLQEGAVAERKWYRNLLMYGFHFVVRLVGISGIADTQCGFKLFTREAAAAIFPSQHVERFAFDVELIYMAQRLGIPLGEVSINWQEIDGSKLDPLWASIEMFGDMMRIKIAYMLGLWKIWRDEGKDQ